METKFVIYGKFHKQNDWVMNGCLAYLASTSDEAIATCKRLHPNFEIHSVVAEKL